MLIFEDITLGQHKPITYEIDNKGCWICTSHFKNKAGYPLIRYCGRTTTMARFILLRNLKISMTYNVYALHKCDTPSCINPEHLYLGTPTENVADAKTRGRRKRSPNTRLSEDNVKEIKSLSRKITQRVIAKMFNVTQQHISAIITGVKWKEDITNVSKR